MAEDSSRFPYCWPSSLRAMLPHPLGNWTVWLRAFLVEATSTTNDHLFSAQDVIVEGRWNIQPRFAGWTLFELRDTHQSTNFVFYGGGVLERLNVLGKGMCRCILFGDHHAEHRAHSEQAPNHCDSCPSFSCPKNSIDGAICSSFHDGLHQ